MQMNGDARPTLLLSDLHLPPGPSDLRRSFRDFLLGPARDAATVYLLGDLFEYWIGDDVGLRVYAPEIEELAALNATGTRIFFQHGNRDFLVGRAFARASGVNLLPDPVVIDLHGVPTLLSHGDLFCTDDVGYQRWRRFSRNPLAQWIYRRLSRARRERIAGGLRNDSDTAKRNKAEQIMDVNSQVVARMIASHGVRRLIHGHTHRPAEHVVTLPAGEARRIVLADWRPDRREYFRVDASGWRRVLLA